MGSGPARLKAAERKECQEHGFYPRVAFSHTSPGMNMFQGQTVLSHEPFLLVSSETITRFHLERVKGVSDGWLVLKPACFPALFSSFRICVEKLEYRTLQPPRAPPQPPARAGHRLHRPPRALGAALRAVTSRFPTPAGGDSGGPEGFAHPLVSLKRCLCLKPNE